MNNRWFRCLITSLEGSPESSSPGGSSSRVLTAVGASTGLLLVILLLGLALRLCLLGRQSVWYDEAFSLTVSRLPLGEMTAKLIEDFVHPPLHYYLLHFWMKLVGFGAYQARLLSAVFGTLAIGLIYLLARYLFEQRTALLAALLLAVSQLGVMYSQEARPYAQVLFFALGAVYLFACALHEKRGLAWWGFIAAAVLTIYTHYYGVFLVAGLLSYALLNRRHYALPWSWLLGGAALALLLFAPWLASGVIEQALRSPKTRPAEQPPWFAVHFGTLASALNRFNNGGLAGVIESTPRLSFLAGGLLFTVPALLGLKPAFARRTAGDQMRRDPVVLLAILWLLPLVLVIGLGALNVQYDVRYVAFCAAPYYILVARGLCGLNSPLLRYAFVVLLLAYSALALRANYFIPYKENYRDALAHLAGQYREGDCCSFLPFGETPLAWSIYHGDHPGLKTVTPDGVASGDVRADRVWLVMYRRVEWAIQRCEEARRKLETTHCKIDERQYFWVVVCLYVPKDAPGSGR